MALEDVSVRYGSKVVLRNICYTLREGSALALLGRNGAGKTTLLRAIVGIVRPCSGRILVFGLPAGSVGAKRLIGYLPERPGVYERLTGLENMLFHAELNGLGRDEAKKRSLELLEAFGLRGVAHERVGSYSKGMKQRLAVARTLLADPPLLLLDEPSSGLDPDGVGVLVEVLRERVGRGVTLLVSTHNPYFARRLCGRALILEEGRVAAEGELDALVFERRVRVRLLKPVGRELLEALLGARLRLGPEDHLVGEFEAAVEGGEDVARLVEELVRAGLKPVGVEPVEALPALGGDHA